jgi:hypothetical protein
LVKKLVPGATILNDYLPCFINPHGHGARLFDPVTSFLQLIAQQTLIRG